MFKIRRIPKIDAFPRGGGEAQFYGQTILNIWALLTLSNPLPEAKLQETYLKKLHLGTLEVCTLGALFKARLRKVLFCESFSLTESQIVAFTKCSCLHIVDCSTFSSGKNLSGRFGYICIYSLFGVGGSGGGCPGRWGGLVLNWVRRKRAVASGKLCDTEVDEDDEDSSLHCFTFFYVFVYRTWKDSP